MSLKAFFDKSWNIVTDYFAAKESKSKGEPRVTSSAPAWPSAGGKSPLERAIAYLENVPGAVSGQRGHDVTYKAARLLVKDFALSIADAFTAIAVWNARCEPPWSDEDLMRKLEEADRNPGELGRLLNAAYERPLSSEEQWLRDLVCRIHWGRTILITGPNNTLVGKEYAPGWDPKDIDLGDLASPAVVAEGLEPTDASPAAADDGQTPAAEVHVPLASLYNPPDESPPEKLAFCPHCVKLLQKHRRKAQFRVLLVTCKTHDCLFCGPRVRNHWITSWTTHLDRWAKKHGGQDVESLWMFRCTRAEWKGRVGHYVRANAGKYMRLDTTCGGTVDGPDPVIISTVKPANLDAQPISPKDAKRRLKFEMDSMLPKFRKGTFSGGNGWCLLPDQLKKKSEWKTVARTNLTQYAIEAMLDEMKAIKENAAWSGRFYPCRATFFVVLEKSIKWVVECFQEGRIMPDEWADDDCTFSSDGKGTWTISLHSDSA